MRPRHRAGSLTEQPPTQHQAARLQRAAGAAGGGGAARRSGPPPAPSIDQCPAAAPHQPLPRRHLRPLRAASGHRSPFLLVRCRSALVHPHPLATQPRVPARRRQRSLRKKARGLLRGCSHTEQRCSGAAGGGRAARLLRRVPAERDDGAAAPRELRRRAGRPAAGGRGSVGRSAKVGAPRSGAPPQGPADRLAHARVRCVRRCASLLRTAPPPPCGCWASPAQRR